MDKVALVTGADRGFGLGLARRLLEMGWTVFAGRIMEWHEYDLLAQDFPETLVSILLDVSSTESVEAAADAVRRKVDRIDLLIANAAINRSHQINGIREALSFDDMQSEVNVNAIGALRTVHHFLPLLDEGSLKRLCFVSSEAGSIEKSSRTGWFGYCMSKAALNMAVKNLWNDLTKDGYTFRLYHPGWMKTYMAGTRNEEANLEPEDAASIALRYFLNEETAETLRLHDWEGRAWPW